MLAAFYLAREGYRQSLLERGQDVDTRSHDVKHFGKRAYLNLNPTYNLGKAAQELSDGKLTTRITHPAVT